MLNFDICTPAGVIKISVVTRVACDRRPIQTLILKRIQAGTHHPGG
jgi:hypothetical protein